MSDFPSEHAADFHVQSADLPLGAAEFEQRLVQTDPIHIGSGCDIHGPLLSQIDSTDVQLPGTAG